MIGGNIFACYVDFRKAFDLLPRDMLLFRLLEQGVDGKMYNAIRNIYSESTCAVRVNDSMTDWFKTEQGLNREIISLRCYSQYMLIL